MKVVFVLVLVMRTIDDGSSQPHQDDEFSDADIASRILVLCKVLQ